MITPQHQNIDPIDLAIQLLRCRSITPEDDGALDLLSNVLSTLGFQCDRHVFATPDSAPVNNLFARIGNTPPLLCFAGHTDVVPPGDLQLWSNPPFEPQHDSSTIVARGVADMKGAVAAFTAAAAQWLAERSSTTDLPGSLGLIITGDEEGPAINGTVKLLAWMKQAGHQIDHCLVGEPTNPERLGEMIKIGRRGSLSAMLTVIGEQGHVAYPHQTVNPLPALARIITRLSTTQLDSGTDHFDPSNLEFTALQCEPWVSNVIPGTARALFNIRFNTLHNADKLWEWLSEVATIAAKPAQIKMQRISASEAFLSQADPFMIHLENAIRNETGLTPIRSTTGGTSDARFIKDYCPVVEFGLVNKTIHKINEEAHRDDIIALTRIYHHFIDRYFAAAT